jgi:hypothetical protein
MLKSPPQGFEHLRVIRCAKLTVVGIAHLAIWTHSKKRPSARSDSAGRSDERTATGA